MTSSVWSEGRGERGAVYGFVVVMAVAAVSIIYLGRDLIFWSDELTWLVFGDDFAPATLLTPHNGHLIALPRFLYELLPRVFGPEYLPFRLVALASFLTCVGLFFLLARRYVGGPIALAPSIVLLFFGSAEEVVLSPLGLPFTLSIAFGLGALLALDRPRRHDPLAAVLLTLSLLSHSFGGLLTIGVVLYLLRADARRRLWVPLVPLALYAGWWVWAQRFDQGIASASNVTEVPSFVAESAVATLSALTGFSESGFDGPTLGGRLGALTGVAEVVFVVAAAAALLVLGLRLRDRPVGPWLWPHLLIVVVYWVALGFSEGPGREPTTPRYLFFGSIMVLLVVAARAGGVRPTRTAGFVLIAFCSVSLVLNLSQLVRAADGIRAVAAEVEIQLTVLELAGEGAKPAFVPRNSGLPGTTHGVAVAAGPYLEFVEATGELGLSSGELSDQSGGVRARADLILAQVEGLSAVPSWPVSPAPSDCERKSAGAGKPASVPLAEGLTLLRLAEPGPSQPLLVGRFASPTVPLGDLDAESFVAVAVSGDPAPETWIAEVATSVEACSPPVAG